jgi:putative acetyltransferase
MHLRPVKNTDSDQIIQIIDDTYQEYGDRVCLDGSESDLKNIEANYQLPDAAFVVMELNGEIVGCHAVQRIENSTFTFKRLYVRADKRGSGAGDLLFKWAIEKAVALKATEIEFWSDVRFHRAHRFFEKYDFVKGHTRDMKDSHNPYSEYLFTRKL